MRRLTLFTCRYGAAVKQCLRGTQQQPTATPSPALEPLYIVRRLYVTKQTHSVTTEHRMKQRLALQAWRDLQHLTDTDVESLDTFSVSTLLAVWAYFAKYWDLGHDGPSRPLPPLSPTAPVDVDEVPVDVASYDPSMHRSGAKKPPGSTPQTSHKIVEKQRRNILDETFV